MFFWEQNKSNFRLKHYKDGNARLNESNEKRQNNIVYISINAHIFWESTKS